MIRAVVSVALAWLLALTPDRSRAVGMTTASGNLEQTATAFFKDYWARHSSSPETTDFAYFGRVWADPAIATGELTSREEVLKSIRDDFAKYTNRQVAALPDTIAVHCDKAAAICSVEGTVRFDETDPAAGVRDVFFQKIGMILSVGPDRVLIEATAKPIEFSGRRIQLGGQNEPNDSATNSQSAEVHARHILVESEQRAKEIIAELNRGADFAALAKKYSKDPGAADGGDLGYFKRDEMVPAFSDAAFALKPGEHTQTPVHTQFGWHVIQVLDRRGAPGQPAVPAQLPGGLDTNQPVLQAMPLPTHSWTILHGPIVAMLQCDPASELGRPEYKSPAAMIENLRAMGVTPQVQVTGTGDHMQVRINATSPLGDGSKLSANYFRDPADCAAALAAAKPPETPISPDLN